jgi:hypothetical protein
MQLKLIVAVNSGEVRWVRLHEERNYELDGD